MLLFFTIQLVNLNIIFMMILEIDLFLDGVCFFKQPWNCCFFYVLLLLFQIMRWFDFARYIACVMYLKCSLPFLFTCRVIFV